MSVKPSLLVLGGRFQKLRDTIALMSTPAQFLVMRGVFDALAALCDELADDHPEFAGAAAHYFRHGAPGRVALPLDELLLDNFVKALYAKLKQKKSGMAVLLEANVLDLLTDGEAFVAGDALAPAGADALADVPPAAPIIPMTPLMGRRAVLPYRSNNANQIRLRQRIWDIMTKAAIRSRMQHQLTEPAAANALQPMQVPGLRVPAVYAAGVAMRYADRVAESPPVAIWKVAVHRIVVVDVEGQVNISRSQQWPFAIASVVFEHDDSSADLLFAREMPTVLAEWAKLPEPKAPLRLRHLTPMRVLGAAAAEVNARRVFVVTNIPLNPVSAARAQAPEVVA